jgi:hypothetical protein
MIALIVQMDLFHPNLSATIIATGSTDGFSDGLTNNEYLFSVKTCTSGRFKP